MRPPPLDVSDDVAQTHRSQPREGARVSLDGGGPLSTATPRTAGVAGSTGPLPTPTTTPRRSHADFDSASSAVKRRSSWLGSADEYADIVADAAASPEAASAPGSPAARGGAVHHRLEAMLPARDKSTYFFDCRSGVGSWSVTVEQRRKNIAVLFTDDAWLGVMFGVDPATSAVVVVDVPRAKARQQHGRKADALLVGDTLDSIGGRRCPRLRWTWALAT